MEKNEKGRTVELREVLDFLRNGSVDVSPSIGWDDAADELEAYFGPRKDPHSGCGSDGWGCAAPVADFDVNCNLGPKNADECDEGCWGFTLEECGHGPENAEGGES